jgi:hypothetical protein
VEKMFNRAFFKASYDVEEELKFDFFGAQLTENNTSMLQTNALMLSNR